MSNIPDIREAVDLALKGGVSLVVCLIIIFVFTKVLQWVFKFVDKLVTDSLVNLTGAMTKLSESIQRMNEVSNLTLAKISQDIKDGFDQVNRTAQYQREEHQRMIEKMEASEKRAEEVREKILNAIEDSSCRAKQ